MSGEELKRILLVAVPMMACVANQSIVYQPYKSLTNPAPEDRSGRGCLQSGTVAKIQLEHRLLDLQVVGHSSANRLVAIEPGESRSVRALIPYMIEGGVGLSNNRMKVGAQVRPSDTLCGNGAVADCLT